MIDLTSRNHPVLTGVFGAMAMLLLSSSAAAHKTFLSAEYAVWAEGSAPEFALTSALEFPDLETGLAQDRIAFLSAAIGGRQVSDIGFTETETALNIRLETDATGLGVLAVSTYPRSGEIPPASVELYFDEINADEPVRAAFRVLEGEPALMRSYAKHTKIIFCVATCEDIALAAATPVGLPLEFVMLSAADRQFALAHDGERLAGHQVTIHTGDGEAFVALTDSEGVFEVVGEASGDILMSAVWIDLPDTADGNYHSEQATMTVRLD
ncbi:hypothetical protein V0U79_04145 [Hyphobacterium sp. HN65]|uniref:DUF4198 domain-containing protein n=1 Tax=Hyphobacterium lacteum TaxID=3116575 RepID=A0ABU7LNQ0_9PROT|nr:hypothetical protein [Hyphobacterium sp. HN65]MEE2525545.1 hypothetical protein [Hyphobacterium sp. HN65]